MFDLHGRVAVVTGASSGLGVQMAKALARAGADLALVARREELLKEVSAEIKALGSDCIYVACSVTDSGAIEAAAKTIEDHYGKIDILINNAGSSAGSYPVEKTTDEAWLKDLEVDLTGVFICTREFGKILLKNKYGRVINIASMFGLVGNPSTPISPYHAAKGGVVNFTRAVAAEWAPKGVNVNAICPGYFWTDATAPYLESAEFMAFLSATVPLGRYGKVGELDAAVLFLASDEASYITGVILPIDGGSTCI
jgi:gluconate 5-dehydrogenase